MAALVSQVPSVNKQKPSTSSIVNPATLFASTENGVRRPAQPINEHDLNLVGIQGKNENGCEEYFKLHNVVSTFKTHCHLDLRTLARQGANVEFKRDPPSVMMKIRNPPMTASIWSAGKVTCIGAKSEADAYTGARRIARKIQKCGFKPRFIDFKVINCLAVARLPFGVRIDRLKDAYPKEFSYEPELHPAASWKLPEVNGQLQVFQTGNLTITAPNEASARATLTAVYNKLYEFRKPKDMTLERNSAAGSATSCKRRQKTPRELHEDLKKIKLGAIEGYEDDDDEEDDE